MKKLFAIAIMTAALAACGGKAKTAEPTTTETGNTGGTEGGATYGGDIGGDSYGGEPYGDAHGTDGDM